MKRSVITTILTTIVACQLVSLVLVCKLNNKLDKAKETVKISEKALKESEEKNDKLNAENTALHNDNSYLNLEKTEFEKEVELLKIDNERLNSEVKKKQAKIKKEEDSPELSKAKKETRKLSEVVENKQSKKEEINVELTAYCNCTKCSDNWGSETAMGTKTRKGVIATPKNIPLGSKLEIPELSWYKSDSVFHVEDRGGAVKQKSDGTHVIDVWFESHEEALRFGRVKTTAYIL